MDVIEQLYSNFIALFITVLYYNRAITLFNLYITVIYQCHIKVLHYLVYYRLTSLHLCFSLPQQALASARHNRNYDI